MSIENPCLSSCSFVSFIPFRFIRSSFDIFIAFLVSSVAISLLLILFPTKSLLYQTSPTLSFSGSIYFFFNVSTYCNIKTILSNCLLPSHCFLFLLFLYESAKVTKDSNKSDSRIKSKNVTTFIFLPYFGEDTFCTRSFNVFSASALLRPTKSFS